MANSTRPQLSQEDSRKVSRRIVFVGNSHTYQPKELGGIPGVVTRMALAVNGTSCVCESVVKGGADLVDLWEDFENMMQRTSSTQWDIVVLQIGRLADPQARFAIVQVLEHRYGPLIRQLHPDCGVLLYQTWSEPWPGVHEEELLMHAAADCQSSLLSAGLIDVRVARAAHAFLAVRDCVDARNLLYPALWKDDMGHGSALAGVLVALVMLLAIGLATSPRRALGRIIEADAILPAAWRTASPGFAGKAQVGQKGWRAGSPGAPAELMELAGVEDDHPLSKYPPGLRTEKRALQADFGDVLVAAATAAAACGRDFTNRPGNLVCNEPNAGAPAGGEAPAAAPSRTRRWQKK